MIVLDTNVLSEEMKPVPAAKVHLWFANQNTDYLFTTAIRQAEILHGVALLPGGRRKDELVVAAQRIFALFEDRVLSFDSRAAVDYANVVAVRRRLGRPINEFDAQIVAISRTQGFALATRNIADFLDAGLVLIDPWA